MTLQFTVATDYFTGHVTLTTIQGIVFMISVDYARSKIKVFIFDGSTFIEKNEIYEFRFSPELVHDQLKLVALPLYQ